MEYRPELYRYVDGTDDSAQRVRLDRENTEQGLAKLVLGLIELIRRLLERQVLHRIDAGTLSDEEIERVGETLMLLERKIREMADIFGIDPDDLNIDLGPLGNLY